MKNNVVSRRFAVNHVGKRHPPHSVFGWENNCLYGWRRQPFQRAGKFKGKVVVAYGLYYVIRSVHRISFHGVLCQTRHENQHRVRVCFPQLVRRCHSVHILHSDIHKHYVVNGRVIFKKADCVRKFDYFESQIFLFFVTRQIFLQYFSVFALVLNHGNFHLLSPSVS